jgi:hypothetical protein
MDEVLFKGRRICVGRREGVGARGDLFEVVFDRYLILLECTDVTWANAFAAALDSFTRQDWSSEDALRAMQTGLSNLVGARYLIADVLTRSAELYQARALEAVEDRERRAATLVASELRTQAIILRGKRSE